MRHKIMLWMWRDDRPEWANRIVDPLVYPVARICCRIWGHERECDCPQPGHGYCAWCLRSMPEVPPNG